MKKILCMLVLGLSAGSALAQLYVRGNIGYNLPANGQQIGSDYKSVYDPQNGVTNTKSEAVYGSFGSGLSFQLAVGGAINGSFGYDVEAGYLNGKKYSVNQHYSNGSDIENQETSTKSQSFQLAPSLTFTAGTGSIQPYTRIGPVIGFTKLKYEDFESDTYNGTKEKTEYEYTGGISVGFKGVLGVVFNADKKVQFFGEVNFLSMSYAPKEGEITAYTFNGDDALNSIPKEQRKIKFKDEVKSGDDANIQLRDKYSMGSIGIQVGVKYLLK